MTRSTSTGAYLTGPEIRKQIKLGNILAEGLHEDAIGPDNMDLYFGDELMLLPRTGKPIDPRDPPALVPVQPRWVAALGELHPGWLIEPGRLYIGACRERVGATCFKPSLSGVSTKARLGLAVHVTAGFFEHGFFGCPVLEIKTTELIILRPGDRIAQLVFATLEGELSPYKGRYMNQDGPVGSRPDPVPPPADLSHTPLVSVRRPRAGKGGGL